MEWLTTTTILDGLRDDPAGEAWDVFVSRFRVPVVAFAARLGLGAADAEEVAQETMLAFVEAYRAGRYDRNRGRLSKWLLGIAYRQALRQRRRIAGREVNVADAGSADGFWGGLPDDRAVAEAWDLEWERTMLERCTDQVRGEVDPVTLQAYEMTVHEGRPAAAAAEALGVPVKTVYNAKHRILKRLRELREQMDDARMA